METTVNERIKQLIDFLKITDRQFSIKTGIPQTTISTYIKRKSEPGSAALSLILKAFPTISAKWLLVGDGEMLTENEVQIGENSIAAARAMNNLTGWEDKMIDRITEQAAKLAIKDKEIELLQEKIRALEENKNGYRNVAETVPKYGK